MVDGVTNASRIVFVSPNGFPRPNRPIDRHAGRQPLSLIGLPTDIQTDRRDRQTHRQTDSQAEREACRRADSSDRQADRQANRRQADSKQGRQTRQTGRQSDGQTDRQRQTDRPALRSKSLRPQKRGNSTWWPRVRYRGPHFSLIGESLPPVGTPVPPAARQWTQRSPEVPVIFQPVPRDRQTDKQIGRQTHNSTKWPLGKNTAGDGLWETWNYPLGRPWLS